MRSDCSQLIFLDRPPRDSNRQARIMESSSSSSNSPITQTRRTRGATTCKNLKKVTDEELTIEFDEHNAPMGEYRAKFTNYVGVCTRKAVPITIEDWRLVPKTLKDMIWEDVKKKWRIPDDSRKKPILKNAGKQWKQFKHDLITDFIEKTNEKFNSPCEKYKYITPSHWEEFVLQKTSDVFTKKSTKAKVSISHSKNPHYLGSAGYVGKRKEWVNSDPLSSSSLCFELNSCIGDRAFDWARARHKQAADGSYYVPVPKTRMVVEKIVQKVQETKLGIFTPDGQHDVLTAALGKSEHPGRVRGCGQMTTMKDVFKTGRSKGSGGMVSEDRVREMIAEAYAQNHVETNTKIDAQINATVQAVLQSLGIQTLEDVRTTLQSSSSHQSVNLDPFDRLKEQGKEKKKNDDKGNKILPSVKISFHIRPPVVDDISYGFLSSNCRTLHDLICCIPTTQDVVSISLSDDPFNTEEDTLQVAISDIANLLTMTWLTQDILKIFSMYLHDLCLENGVESIAFMAPDRIADGYGQKPENISYMARTIFKYQFKNLILAPYFQQQYWVLLVICPKRSNVWYFDPKRKPKHNIKIKQALQVAFAQYWSSGGPRLNSQLKFVPVECPQQSRDNECGYYVMRYMLEIINIYHGVEAFDKVSLGAGSYLQEQIDEDRDLWAQYYMCL